MECWVTMATSSKPLSLPPHSSALLPPTNLRSHLAQSLNHVQLFVVPWTVAHQAPLPIKYPRQEYWSGWHFLLQGIFATRGLNSWLLHLLHWQTDSFSLVPPGKPILRLCKIQFCFHNEKLWDACLLYWVFPCILGYLGYKRKLLAGKTS